MSKKAQYDSKTVGPFKIADITPYLMKALEPTGWFGVFLSINDRRKVAKGATDGCSADTLAAMQGMKYSEMRLNTETELLKRKITDQILPWTKNSHAPAHIGITDYPFSDIETYVEGLAELYRAYYKMTQKRVDDTLYMYVNWIINKDYERFDLIGKGIKKDFKPRKKREIVKDMILDEDKTVTQIADELHIPKKQVSRMISEQKAIDRPAPIVRPVSSDYASPTKFVQSLMKYNSANNITMKNKEIAMEANLNPKSISAIKSYMRKDK